jgi:glucose/arabinose dehydrogenase
MQILVKQMVALGLLFLSGCDAMQNMRNDFTRLTSLPITGLQARAAPERQATVRPRTSATTSTPSTSAKTMAEDPAPVPTPTAGTPPDPPAVALAGKSETEIRAMLGTPTKEEDRSPGKQWRYRDGQCTYDVQLYRDVRTKQFGTLGYEVKSDDSTNDGKRLCMARLRSRVQAGQ